MHHVDRRFGLLMVGIPVRMKVEYCLLFGHCMD